MTGSLGDTLAALPALWAVRQHWPHAQLRLLSDCQIDLALVSPQSILSGAGLIDEFLTYPVSSSQATILGKVKSALGLWSIVRHTKSDVLVYLIRAFDGDSRVRRDHAFFRLAGLRKIIGGSHLFKPPCNKQQDDIPKLPWLADLYLARLRAEGIPVPEEGQGRMELGLGKAEHDTVEVWRKGLHDDGGRPWIAVGVGSKMPAKRWPVERFEAVGHRLIQEHDIWPVVFGGPEERELGIALTAAWGRGYVAAGKLALRPAAAALRCCHLYVGNDTGTMHLAASVGVRCVAIFSARDYPGLWEPYGTGHIVLREKVWCAGCHAEVCPQQMECLTGIGVSRVSETCLGVLSALPRGQHLISPSG